MAAALRAAKGERIVGRSNQPQASSDDYVDVEVRRQKRRKLDDKAHSQENAAATASGSQDSAATKAATAGKSPTKSLDGDAKMDDK